MAGINKVILVGNLGRDPEVRYTPDGTAVCNFSIATSEEWKDKNSGEKKSKTEWHRVVVWRRLAEVCGEYLHQGKQVYIEGKLQTREWEDEKNGGIKRYTTEIVASTMQMLGRRDDNQDQPGGGGSYRQQSQGGYSNPTPNQNNSGGGYPQGGMGNSMIDDDIPF